MICRIKLCVFFKESVYCCSIHCFKHCWKAPISHIKKERIRNPVSVFINVVQHYCGVLFSTFTLAECTVLCVSSPNSQNCSILLSFLYVFAIWPFLNLQWSVENNCWWPSTLSCSTKWCFLNLPWNLVCKPMSSVSSCDKYSYLLQKTLHNDETKTCIFNYIHFSIILKWWKMDAVQPKSITLKSHWFCLAEKNFEKTLGWNEQNDFCWTKLG